MNLSRVILHGDRKEGSTHYVLFVGYQDDLQREKNVKLIYMQYNQNEGSRTIHDVLQYIQCIDTIRLQYQLYINTC